MEGALIDQSKGGGIMPPIVLNIEIALPPDEVFSYVTDPSRFAEWQADAVRGRLEGGSPPGVGSRFITTRRVGRVERTTTSEITEVNPPAAGLITVLTDRSGQSRTSPSHLWATAQGRASRSTSTSRATGSASYSCRSSAGWDARTVPRTVGTSRNGSRAAISTPRAASTSIRSSRTRLPETSFGSPETGTPRVYRKRETYA